MNIKILEIMLQKAGIYGLAFNKKTEELMYLSPMLAGSYPNAKIGENYKTAVPAHSLFGDGSKNTKGLLFDPCEDGIWFDMHTTNITLEDGTEVVVMFAVPTEKPKDMIMVKTEEV